jgi:hypothetical protein
MKNPIRFRSAFSIAFLLACALPGRAQDLKSDTLAVRILLDQNGLTATPVSQVIQIDPASQRVIALRAPNLKIASLPEQIGTMDALKYLVLGGNLLDSLPAAVWGLSHLVELDLGDNRIGTLDARVGQLQSLLLLGLRGNGLSSLPAPLFALPQLEDLLLADNALDTLPEAVAELPFLRYLDVSGNVLRTLPYTVAALDALDSLDASSNAMESLPDAITGMHAATKVRLASNRLCALSPALAAWATSKDPAWQASQTCGAAIRPRAARSAGPSLRAWSEGGALRLDWSGMDRIAGARVLILRDAAGRESARLDLAVGEAEARLTRSAPGFLWAELRAGGRIVATAAVLP